MHFQDCCSHRSKFWYTEQSELMTLFVSQCITCRQRGPYAPTIGYRVPRYSGSRTAIRHSRCLSTLSTTTVKPLTGPVGALLKGATQYPHILPQSTRARTRQKAESKQAKSQLVVNPEVCLGSQLSLPVTNVASRCEHMDAGEVCGLVRGGV